MACAAACYCCPCFFFKLPSGCKLNCKFVLIPVVLYDNFIINDQLRQKNKKIGKKGLNKSNRHITHHYRVLLLFSVSGEKAEVAIAILPLLTIGKGCNMQTQGICGIYLCKCILVMLIHSSQMCNSKYMNLKVNY